MLLKLVCTTHQQSQLAGPRVFLHAYGRINPTRFFIKNAFSDVATKFGHQEFKAHKIILATQSEYFNKLCGPNASCAKQSQAVVKLESDQEFAFHAMLQFLYQFDYNQEGLEVPRPRGVPFPSSMCTLRQIRRRKKKDACA